MFKSAYTRFLETEVERLRAELASRTDAFTSELSNRERVFRADIGAVRAEASKTLAYAQNLVSAVLIKNGLYTAEQMERMRVPDEADEGVVSGQRHVPLVELQREAEQAELAELVEKLQAEAALLEGDE